MMVNPQFENVNQEKRDLIKIGAAPFSVLKHFGHISSQHPK
jgi:hypothetical protein